MKATIGTGTSVTVLDHHEILDRLDTGTTAGEELLAYRVDVPVGRRGPWSIQHVEATLASMSGLMAALRGEPYTAGTFTVLAHDRRGTVMADTGPEVWESMPIIRHGHGRVLVHGLGLGVVVKALLAKPEVTHIDVVELDPDVIALVGPHYPDPRLVIHQGDALTFRFPPGTRWDCAWHDFWDKTLPENLPAMRRMHRRYARRVGWQASWNRERCEAMARGDNLVNGCKIPEWA